MPHSASSSIVPPSSLDRPSVFTDTSGRISAGSASLLLDMEGNFAASTTQGVRLVAPLSKGAGSLGHDEAVLSSLKLFKGLSHGCKRCWIMKLSQLNKRI